MREVKGAYERLRGGAWSKAAAVAAATVSVQGRHKALKG